MSVVVFLGPSLPLAEARQLLAGADYRPPARCGDVYRIVLDRQAEAIALIDGEFENAPAVWHREILWALAEGVAVFGAASMGALRAAELGRFGMQGVGKVFRAFRDNCYDPFDGPFEDDDEVAVLHAPADRGYATLSDAMVDLRETLAAASSSGLIDAAMREALAAGMKRLPFPERSFRRLAAAASERLGAEAGAAFGAWLARNRLSQKRRDAAALLLHLASRSIPEVPPAAEKHPAFRFERTLFWERFRAAEDARGPAAALSPVDAAVLEELALDPDAWRETERAALGRLPPRPGSPRDGAATDAAPAAAGQALTRFRRARGLVLRADLDAWLADNGLDAAGVLRLAVAEAALDARAVRRRPELAPAMVDELRVSGRYAELRRRSEAKREALLAQGTADGEGPGGLALHLAAVWYFEQRLRRSVPHPLAAHARSVGFADEAGFQMAVWREYRAAAKKGTERASPPAG